MAYANPLNPATPADGNFLREGDDRIRELKAALIERLQTIIQNIDTQPLAFIAGIIPTAAIADGAITLPKMAGNSVSTNTLVDGAATDPKIVSVNGSKLFDGSVAGAKLADDTVTGSKIASGAIGVNELADDAVGGAKIIDAGIANSKLIDNSLTDAKLSAALRQNLVKQNHTDFQVLTFSLATNTSWDSADLPIGGVIELDSLVVSMESAAVGWVAAMKLITFYAYVSSTGNVRLRLQNNTGGPVTIPTSNWRILALRRYSDWYP
jgi:hypothetical protein